MTMLRACLLCWFCLTPSLLRADSPGKTLDHRKGPAAAHQAELDAARASNQFALALYALLRGHDGNVLLSPLAITSSLGLASAGARGETHEQMVRALRLPPGPAAHAGLGRLLRRLSLAQPGCRLSTANALWGHKDLDWSEVFTRLAREQYGSGVHSIDFSQPEEARKHINAWAEKQTDRRISNLLRPGAVDGDTRLVLASAVCFTGDWITPFRKEHTREEAFHVKPHHSVKVPLMRQEKEFDYHAAGGVQVLEVPYAGKRFSLVVLLPRLGELAELEKSLTPKRLDGLLQGLRPEKVQVSLPRFRMSVETKVHRALARMGVSLPFSEAADFSGLGKGEGLRLSAMLHQADVEVDEQGTKATAATAAMLQGRSIGPPATFRADRPFVFLIRDGRTGCIVFLGRLALPRG